MRDIYTSFVDQKVINMCFYATKELALKYAMDYLRMSSSGEVYEPKLDRGDDAKGYWLYLAKEEIDTHDEAGDWAVWFDKHEILVARRTVIEY